jgi:RNA polymerase sigma-70 factor (ECF subfamily)
LTQAAKELPEGCRTIFLLHEVEGYEHHEIAERLRCSIGNSKSQLHKARLKMRKLLASGRKRIGRKRIPGTPSKGLAIRPLPTPA